ncbi:MAG: polysaccharide biosynthesis tyrosine autokinase [Propioniciclava sp.]|uniref:polysaccharide biosynthesis tyrosine autokinase n=1 Tax=Propioniciclava sp. TaxID=2038686 RepID=UPI0039E68174
MAQYLTVLKRHVLLIFILVLLGGVGSYLYANTLPKLYRSFSSVMVVPEQGQTTLEIVQGSNYVAGIVESYALLATSPYVLQPVIDELGLEETPIQLARSVIVETPLNTTILELAVTAGSPEEARAKNEAVSRSLIKAVSELSPRIGNQSSVRLTLISPASLPVSHVSPDNRIYALSGGAAGLVVAVLAAFLREFLRSRPRNSDDLSEFTDLPVLGEIPRLPRDSANLPSAMLKAPDGPVAEGLRALAASLRFVSVNQQVQTLIVTSARPSDGKTSVSAALALTFAEAGRRTLVIDADLRNPSIARLTGVEPGIGLSTVLLHDCDFEEAVQPWGHENLHVLAGGPLVPNPGQLISSGRLAEVIAIARGEYDAVIIDTPPVLPVSDAMWLAPSSDGVILVARASKTPSRAIRAALSAMAATGTAVLGLVLNGAVMTVDSRYHGTYGQNAKQRPWLPSSRPATYGNGKSDSRGR